MEPNHPFRSDIEIINSKIVAIVTTINATMNEAEAANLLRQACRSVEPSQESLVVPGRRLVREVTCACKMESGKAKEARVLILNDMLVVATVNRSFFSSKTTWQYRMSVPMARLVLEEEGESSLVVLVRDVDGNGIDGNGITENDPMNRGADNNSSANCDMANGVKNDMENCSNATSKPTANTTNPTPSNTQTTPLFTLIWEHASEKDSFQSQIRQLQSHPA